MLVYALGKYGKTTFGATLDKLCKDTLGKPALFVACEAGKGGGTMSIQEFGVDVVIPQSLNELRAIITSLVGDQNYGGVVLDSSTEVVNRFIKPYALKFPSKMRDPRREAGVPARDDYQTMGEEMRKLLNSLIALTCNPDPKLCKHLIVTALLKERTDDNGNIIKIHPDLPGAMADTATAMFQTVGTIKVKTRVVRGEDNKPCRVNDRVLVTEGDGVMVLGDRTHCFPAEGPLDMSVIWEKYWVPRFTTAAPIAA
jgi:hypothetical protein